MKINKNVIFAEQINKRDWWHSPPQDKKAYKERGIFLASSYKECEFYGRPLDKPIKVNVKTPLIDTEENIIKNLFGLNSKQMNAFKSLVDGTARDVLKIRFQLDKQIFKTAKNQGYDAIAIVTNKGLEKVKEGKLPRSIELNVFDMAHFVSESSIQQRIQAKVESTQEKASLKYLKELSSLNS